MESLDELSKREQQREKDGFPKKIKTRRIMVGPGRIINVPYIEEEKLVHGEFEPSDASDQGKPGHGEGDIGDVIGEIPLWGEGEGDGDGESDEPHAGQGEGGDHGEEEEAYRFGKELAAQFQLPNLKDKGKKVPTDEYVYDLTDRHRGSGQLLDKKATLKSAIRTNAGLGRIDPRNIDPSKLVIGPQDKIYRVLSRERVWKSQAIVFFLRDYSGSMWGEPTKAVIIQHLMIYAWLMDQYDKLVIPRFVVHEHTAREVSVRAYFRLQASGGTLIASGYKKILEIIESEGLARDYNIYVFQGTDGDDFDDGRIATPEIEKILGYVNRMGVSVLKHPFYGGQDTIFENYIKQANFLGKRDLFRMHVMLSTEVTDDKNIEAVKTLIAQD
ncbi:hypothetical protein A2926_01365 [Candidatus Giovannonibacteria bacterium RIFCSPLOWO2_01_FULL_44_40]|uniref:Sporulation protein YhbH n=1 Tax=Candidatus Giovannonibacteria bacterium RIFCSPHIGHO2_01_FULL_45_23 TaxID=1798325 RepID=A0A1F5VF96_9BACT|nr:MAG: hypothetical protein A2834_01555 [Candidatus Giovannonibacteria bacterium RIFCSPHIGHO2_01_FULL_45_23]OGF79692.1 MAG: hypothetical protein A2926_01365 [Candidatus Giovannonibacteria bacterium RIFCSPLOWO2_01_FULL_44_40]